jgi:hypothetical protein
MPTAPAPDASTSLTILDLFTVVLASFAPTSEMLAVVGEQIVGVLAEPTPRPFNRNVDLIAHVILANPNLATSSQPES